MLPTCECRCGWRSRTGCTTRAVAVMGRMDLCMPPHRSAVAAARPCNVDTSSFEARIVSYSQVVGFRRLYLVDLCMQGGWVGVLPLVNLRAHRACAQRRVGRWYNGAPIECGSARAALYISPWPAGLFSRSAVLSIDRVGQSVSWPAKLSMSRRVE